MTQVEAAEPLGLSVRQVERLYRGRRGIRPVIASSSPKLSWRTFSATRGLRPPFKKEVELTLPSYLHRLTAANAPYLLNATEPAPPERAAVVRAEERAWCDLAVASDVESDADVVRIAGIPTVREAAGPSGARR